MALLYVGNGWPYLPLQWASFSYFCNFLFNEMGGSGLLLKSY